MREPEGRGVKLDSVFRKRELCGELGPVRSGAGDVGTLSALGRFLAPYFKPLKHFFVSWAADLLASLKEKT